MSCLGPEALPTEGPGTPARQTHTAGLGLTSIAKLTKPAPRVPGDTLFLGSVGLGKAGPWAGNGSEQQRPHFSRHKKTQEHKHVDFKNRICPRNGKKERKRKSWVEGYRRRLPLRSILQTPRCRHGTVPMANDPLFLEQENQARSKCQDEKENRL